jgi:hypothetical protein
MAGAVAFRRRISSAALKPPHGTLYGAVKNSHSCSYGEQKLLRRGSCRVVEKTVESGVAVFDEPQSVFQRLQQDAGRRPLNLLE